MRIGRLVLYLLAALAAGEAAAASLTVAPTRIDLADGDTSAAVTLQNNDAQTVMVQVQTFAWPDGPATAELLPTRDLIAVPPVFEIAGSARQIIRVALRAPLAGPREHAFRLLITEVPRGGARSTGVRFALRLSLPVFVTPSGAEPIPVWSLRADGRGGTTLVLRNEGQAHLQVRRIAWRPHGRPGVAMSTDTPAWVLAGREQSWPLPVGTEPGPVQLEAETSIGPLHATVAAAGG
ncbi:MAG: molecular chaperone [Geminicoccaceae bacterium]